MAAQLPLAETIATASDDSSDTGHWSSNKDIQMLCYICMEEINIFTFR